ncbi:UDP-3-O-acylglucosamine N-acyltransferase [Labrys miyagiensis]|uniref:UDP-3-O-acylglucosamine N-acyltransferase n=2 Tax=Labrys miyagiensis TaxID=346912 RepID=A0ABQ6CLD1_9HYPH|nr:UDP-3-O-acylglucosamine N-acyltransferase [Labrys miyagiensis]
MMTDPVFFRARSRLAVADITRLTGAEPIEGLSADIAVERVAPLDQAGEGDLSFLENPHYLPMLATSKAALILISPKFLDRAPKSAPLMVAREPYRAFAQIGIALFPEAARPQSFFGAKGVSPGAVVHPEARLEIGVTVDPGAVIGPRAEIGAGTIIGANAVIGPDVRIGRDCSISANAVIQHSLIGNRVIIHSGACLGQDGFGFSMGPRGHLKVPQVGRVVIQDDVEIGAGTTVDRGANRDTIVGEGTKIDNQVQIGHNVMVGRHCVLVAKVGISGSTVLEDFVVMGGASATVGHIRIGMGAQIAGAANVKDDVPPGARMAGTPAQPLGDFARELALLKRLVKETRVRSDTKNEG